MISAVMLRHFGFCLSVGLELSGFEFKSNLDLVQVCKNQKKNIFPSSPALPFWPGTAGGPAPRLPSFLLHHAHGSAARSTRRPAPAPIYIARTRACAPAA